MVTTTLYMYLTDSKCRALYGNVTVASILLRIIDSNPSVSFYLPSRSIDAHSLLVFPTSLIHSLHFLIISCSIAKTFYESENKHCKQLSITFSKPCLQSQFPFIFRSHFDSLQEDILYDAVSAINAMSRMASCRSMLSEGVNADMALIRISQADSERLKSNCARTLKNLTSDVNEAIGEGDVAALIAMSLEVRQRVYLITYDIYICIYCQR